MRIPQALGRRETERHPMKQITVSVRNVYGNETIYPACETSRFFAALAGTRTLTSEALRLIVANGYAVTAEAPRLIVRGA